MRGSWPQVGLRFRRFLGRTLARGWVGGWGGFGTFIEVSIGGRGTFIGVSRGLESVARTLARGWAAVLVAFRPGRITGSIVAIHRSKAPIGY